MNRAPVLLLGPEVRTVPSLAARTISANEVNAPGMIPAAIADPLAPIRQRFVEVAEGHIVAMAQLIQRCEPLAERREALAGISLIAHRVAGVAATLGFESLGTTAAELDRRIDAALKSAEPLQLRELDGLINVFHAGLQNVVGQRAS